MRCMVSLDRPQAGSTLFDGRAYPQLQRPLTEVGALLDAGLRPSVPHRAQPPPRLRRGRTASARPGSTRSWRSSASRRSPRRRSAASRSACASGSAWHWRCWATPAPSLLDEPGNGLDPEGIQWVREFLQALARQGRTRVRVQPPARRDGADGRGPRRDRPGAGSSPRRAWPSSSPRAPPAGWSSGGPTWAGSRRCSTAQGARVEPNADGALHVYDAEPAAIGELAFANGVVLHELAPRQGSLEEAFLQATAEAQEYRTGNVLPPPEVPA